MKLDQNLVNGTKKKRNWILGQGVDKNPRIKIEAYGGPEDKSRQQISK